MNLRTYITAIALLIGPAMAHADRLTVFAAASLRGALDDIAALSTDKITLSYAGSGQIARQVSQGAPADVVVLAHPDWMDWLEDRGVLINASRANIAANTLVVIGAAGSAPSATSDDIKTRLSQAHIAMGQREAVPAGIYAKAWLETAGLWAQAEPNIIETANVRLALALVARGEVPYGITYRSDALSDPRVTVIHTINPVQHPSIRYPAAAITPQGHDFIALLSSPKAQAIFHTHGFAPVMQE